MSSIQDATQLKQFLEYGSETVNLDFKGSHLLDKTALLELVKDIFAMANTRGGGVIIIGVDEVDGRFKNTGISLSDLASFKEDDLKDIAGRCASSAVSFSSRIVEWEENPYLLIQISEFEEFPVICACSQSKTLKSADNTTNQVCIFRDGDIFIRSMETRPASRLIRTHIETKELIELAIDKAARSIASARMDASHNAISYFIGARKRPT